MDLRDIGKLFMVGFPGSAWSPELKDFLDDLNPCGVILFARNIETPEQTARLNREIQTHILKKSANGLFIGVDQEGGRVRRLKDPYTAFPPALELASAVDPQAAVREFATVTAREIRLVGFNTDFVPVMDVIAQTEDLASSVIGDRSYGFEPAIVSNLGRIVIECMRSEGVIPCCKHFPGHGGTSVDSHLELPVDQREAAVMERFDLAPFKSAVDMNIEMVMTAHVLFPAWDSTRPATLSPTIVEGLLRKRLGHRGLVVTDDLDMGAVAATYTPEESSFRAFAAGADILLICNSPAKALSARTALYEAFKSGEIPKTRFDESLTRIQLLKDRYASSMLPCDETAVREYFASR